MITDLNLNNFRNYRELSFKCNHRINVFTGANGQGKTNLLEAVFFLSMLRSFRTFRINDLKKISSGGFQISADLSDRESGFKKNLRIDYFKKKELFLDSKKIYKAGDFIKQFRAVVFSPEDIRIVTGAAGLRRRFMDMMISNLSSYYMACLSKYGRALDARNKLLQHGGDKHIFNAYERILAENGSRVVQFRKKYSELLETELKKVLNAFDSTLGNIEILYKYNHSTSEIANYISELENTRLKDKERAYTSFGPHLDNVQFSSDKKKLRNFGSNGQCRLFSLCLKMAKVNVMLKQHDDSAELIVLVDDVTGELDDKAKKGFFDVVNTADQAFFTFTEEPDDVFFRDASFYKIRNAELEQLHK